MAFLIGLGTALYHTAIRAAAPFNPKAAQWVNGRKGSWERLEAKADALRGCLWMHCASVGEFEQGRPVLEAIKAHYPELPVLLTFFSPSGYKAFEKTPLATHVEYLPPDSAANAELLMRLVRPKVAIFIKYEFWYQHLMALQRASIPTFLVSAIFRQSQPFFRWYGAAHRSILGCFTHLFVQDDASLRLLQGIGLTNVSISGDTRFDRVSAIVDANVEIPEAAAFRNASPDPILVVGSSWPADERIIREAIDGLTIRTVLVPHELKEEHLLQLQHLFPAPVMRWTKNAPDHTTRTLLVDRMGLLSKLYRYADITYVGGGFGSGIHNTLEAAAWGKPVIFGPNHQRFAEAHGLIASGAGTSGKNAHELRAALERYVQDRVALNTASEQAAKYVRQHRGATALVVQRLRDVLA